MSAKSKMPGVPCESGVLTPAQGPFSGRFVQVDVGDHRSVENDTDPAPFSPDFLEIPRSRGRLIAAKRRRDSVDRSVDLPRLQTGVLGMTVVENLKFHPLIRGIAGRW